MSDSFLFDTNFQRLETALRAREQMQSVHAANIANADVPNYKADTRTFQSIFQGLNRQTSDEGRLARTNSRHMSGSFTSSMLDMDAAARSSGSEHMDGNTVDVQKETEGMAENQMMQEFTLRLMSGEIQDIQGVLKGTK
jgi:flagellar basal-body rod protein FlgB